jgi:pyridoxine 5-phosphate synthase
LSITRDIINFGADGITVHPRPDERHITYKDVRVISKLIKDEFPLIEFNIEGFPSSNFIDLVQEVKPNQVTLVPDPPNILTSNEGWDIKKNKKKLIQVIQKIKNEKNRICLFVNPDLNITMGLKDLGVDSIELFTGEYAEQFLLNKKETVINKYIHAAKRAHAINIGVNAGHDLNLNNLKYFSQNIKALDEVSIGHALICDSLYYGLENTIQLYKRNLV